MNYLINAKEKSKKINKINATILSTIDSKINIPFVEEIGVSTINDTLYGFIKYYYQDKERF